MLGSRPSELSAQTLIGAPDQTDATLLSRLNAVRMIVILLIGLGYASTMAVGPGAREWLHSLGYDPSWYGIQVLFFLSGWLAWRSLASGRGIIAFVRSRVRRTLPWVLLYTLVITAVLYPLLCNHDSPLAQGTLHLALYFAKTVTLVDPGGPMPGALDDALYACLLQGTIWTLRWGAIAFAGLICAYLAGLRARSLAILFMLCVIAHVTVSTWSLHSGAAWLDPLLPGLRLGYAFLFGALARAARPHFPSSWTGWLAISVTCLGLATLHYIGMRWTHMIEVLASLGWCSFAMTLLHSRLPGLQGWPNLTLPVYLGVWPLAQWLLYQNQGISVPALVAATLFLAVGLALILRGIVSGVRISVHRRVQTA